MILDIQKSWKHNSVFPYALYPASPNVAVFYHYCTIIKTKKINIDTTLTNLWTSFRFHQCFPPMFFSVQGPTLHLVIMSPWSPPICDNSSVFPCPSWHWHLRKILVRVGFVWCFLLMWQGVWEKVPQRWSALLNKLYQRIITTWLITSDIKFNHWINVASVINIELGVFILFYGL